MRYSVVVWNLTCGGSHKTVHKFCCRTYAHYEHAPLHPHCSLTLLSSPVRVHLLCSLSLAVFKALDDPLLHPNPIDALVLFIVQVFGVRLLYSPSCACCFMERCLISNRRDVPVLTMWFVANSMIASMVCFGRIRSC
ncbi:hypothetical protein VNO78_10319 [Psophocarpus tetragonolobus]|uniref:Uncharacterized protein n=1 Tax=Psophocarpus tetragonolobus TaxID=3891 RepID=A0AAN9XM57_PSOTE